MKNFYFKLGSMCSRQLIRMSVGSYTVHLIAD